jgi:hypothetical protein
MKANELRINNYYELKGSVLGGGICQLKNLKDFIHIGDLIESDLVKPIPLTEEWLLKFGFKKNEIPTALKEFYIVNYQLENFVVYLLENSFEIELINKNKDQFNLFINPKKQVHTLQNIYFAITNNELEIL